MRGWDPMMGYGNYGGLFMWLIWIIIIGVVLEESGMNYYNSKAVETGFDEAVSRITQALQEEGFRILTEIDVTSTREATCP